jgi:hypothetical protein
MTLKFKYPRTPHLPWSQGNIEEDDLVLKHTHHFVGKEVIVTEKLDGENTNMYADYMHARSINYRPHPSRDRVKRLHAQLAPHIPTGWRLCGENVYARHSIAYDNLEGYFYLFSVWNEKNTCLSWEETLEWANLLELPTPREFYRGIWNDKIIEKLSVHVDSCEGYVVRNSQPFSYETFDLNVAKWVRKSHVTTDQNWLHQEVIPNRLAPAAVKG